MSEGQTLPALVGDANAVTQPPNEATEVQLDAVNNKRTHSQMEVDSHGDDAQQPPADDIVPQPDEKRIRLDNIATSPPTQPVTNENTNTEPVVSTPVTTPKPSYRAALLDKLKKQKTKLDKIVANEPEPQVPATPAPTQPVTSTTPSEVSPKAGTTPGKKRGRKPKSARPPSPLPSDDDESKRTGRQRRASTTKFNEATSKITDVGFQQCYKLLQAMKNHRWAWPFNQAVDPERLGIPDYFNIIKKPMDLGLVERILLDGGYPNIQDFADDVQLVWQNCLTYNQPGSDVVRMAEELKRLFTEKWQKLVADLEAGVFVAEAPSSPKKTPSKYVEPISDEVISKPRAPRPARKKAAVDSRPMSFEEKKVLSSDITKLTVDMLQRVVEIIQSRAPTASSQANDMEIEIDLDKLDATTLRELEKYVKGAIGKKKGGSKKKSKATAEGTSSATLVPATSNTAEEGGNDDKTKKKNDDSESSGGSSDESSGTDTSSDSGSSDSESESDSEKKKFLSGLNQNASGPQSLSTQSTSTPQASTIVDSLDNSITGLDRNAGTTDKEASLVSGTPTIIMPNQPESVKQEQAVEIKNVQGWLTMDEDSDDEESKVSSAPQTDSTWSDFQSKNIQLKQRQKELEEKKIKEAEEKQRKLEEEAKAKEQARLDYEKQQELERENAKRERERFVQSQQQKMQEDSEFDESMFSGM